MGIVLAVYTRVRLVGASYSDSTDHGAAYEVAIWSFVFALMVAYTVAALVRLRISTPRAVLARRFGLAAGCISGVVMLVATSPGLMGASDSDPLSLTPNGWLFLMAFGIPVAFGIAASHASGDPRVGVDTGWWAGIVSGAILIVGLLVLTYGATSWYVHDRATVVAYHSYWPPQPGVHQVHYRSITAFLLNANMVTAAVIGVLVLPVLCYLAGWIGAAIDRALMTRRST